MSKTIYCSFFFFLLIATSCINKPESDTLASRWPVFGDIYALKDAYPDSALKLLLPIADTLDVHALEQQHPYQLAEYQILDAEIQYKNYLLTKREDHVMEAFHFYASKSRGRIISRLLLRSAN